MHRSDTSTDYGNYDYYCNRCGERLVNCTCWEHLPDENEVRDYAKFTKNIPNNTILFSPVPNVVRRTPSHISGMRGLKLMRRLNKR